MFKKNKWEAWYDAQPEHIKRWMDEPRPLWYDRDLFKAAVTGFIIGLVLGLII